MNLYIKYLVITAIFLIGGSYLMYLVEHDNPNSQINNMLDAIWWTVATITTVGYGDIVPTSDFGRIAGIVYMFVGIIILGMFIAQIRSSILGKNKLGKDVENNLTKQIKKVEDKQDKLFEIVNELKNKPLKNDEKTNIQSENSNNMDKPNSILSDEVNELLSEYNRLLKEAENAQGIDEEDLPKQLKEIRDKFKQITGRYIDSF